MERVNKLTGGAGGFLDFLIQSLAIMANDPTNKKFFLPIFLGGIKINGDQPLVPFQTVLDMGRVSELYDNVSASVCRSGWGALNNYPAAYATDNPEINLTAVTINGLNNAKITDYQTFAPNSQMQYAIIFTATMNAYSTYDQFSFNPGAFYFDVGCESADKKHSADIDSTGTFTAAVTAASFNIVLLVTLNDNLTANVVIPETFTPPGGAAMNGLGITFPTVNSLSIQNVLITGDSPLKPSIEKFIKSAFSNSQTVGQIELLFNNTLNGENIRNPVASGIQDQFNSLINSLK